MSDERWTTERELLLDGIRRHPEDDTVRLAYADWLGEYGSGDRDAATAEFIRLSCPNRIGAKRDDQMPAAAYRWLLDTHFEPDSPSPRVREVVVANWQRLVPGALAAHHPNGGLTMLQHRTGRQIWAELRLLVPAVPTDKLPIYRPTPCNFWFRRGFCEGFRVCHRGARALLAPLVLADQPLCRVWEPETKEAAAAERGGWL